MRRVRLWPCLLLLALGAFACDDFPADGLVGVRTDSAGSFRIQVFLCPGDEVTSVRLVKVTGSVFGDGDDPVLWAIRSSDGSRVDEFVPGRVSPGFSEEVPLKGDIERGAELGVLIDGPGGSPGVAFRMEDLRPGFLYSKGEFLTEPEFRDRAADVCSGPGGGLFGVLVTTSN